MLVHIFHSSHGLDCGGPVPAQGGGTCTAVWKQSAVLWPRSAKAARRRTWDLGGWQEGRETEEELSEQ